jgi:ElaB/YqjD/DUF883 family membrane-anchored ribosome-binding protein
MPAEKTPEQIEREMLETRESITEKVSELEKQVIGTVQTAAETLNETVDAVKNFVHTAPEAVSDTVEQVTEAVKERVQETFDISSHVRANPVASLGISAGLGFLAGYVLMPARQSRSAGYSPTSSGSTPFPTLAPSVPESRGPGLIGSLIQRLESKVRDIATTALDAAMESLNRNVRENVPRLIDDAARMVQNRAEEAVSSVVSSTGRTNHAYQG